MGCLLCQETAISHIRCTSYIKPAISLKHHSDLYIPFYIIFTGHRTHVIEASIPRYWTEIIMATHRALVLRSRNRLPTLETVPRPTAKAGQVVISWPQILCVACLRYSTAPVSTRSRFPCHRKGLRSWSWRRQTRSRTTPLLRHYDPRSRWPECFDFVWHSYRWLPGGSETSFSKNTLLWL